MAHEHEHIDSLPENATNSDIVAKVNELISLINHMWFPDE